MITPIGTEVYSGIKIKYPEFEVLTPQRRQTFSIRTMTTAEEEVLKGSLMTPLTVSEHLAQVLWTCIVKRPDEIKTYDDFIHKVTLRDRDTLVYGLYVATYKDTQTFTVTCASCGKQTKVKINMENGFNFKMWDKDSDCLTTKVEVPLKILEGYKCFLKVPTIADEIETNKISANMSEAEASMAVDLMQVDRFVCPPDQAGGNEETLSDKHNIVQLYSQLPSIDRKLITQKYKENFDEYRISVNAKNTCQCGNVQDFRVDVTRQFFLALY